MILHVPLQRASSHHGTYRFPVCGTCFLTPIHDVQTAEVNLNPITIRTHKFTINRLLCRRQFILEVLHPLRPNVSKRDLRERLAGVFYTDIPQVVLFGFRTDPGGQRSTGFGLIYDNEVAQRKFECRPRLVRVGNLFLSCDLQTGS